MSHETPTIEVKMRDRLGSRYAQRLRQVGRLPAVIYGHGQPPQHVSVDEREVLRHLHAGTHVMNLALDGSAAETCLIKDLQFGYLGDNVIHIDFARVNLDEEVTVHVTLHFLGELKSAGKAGAVVSHDLTELEVTCRVTDIPEEIKVDLSRFDDTVTVADLELPPGVRTDLPPTEPVAHVSFVQAEPAPGEEAELEVEGESPEVIERREREAEQE